MQNVNLSAIDLNLLTSLEVLLDECHIQNAADRLNISQPSMSRRFARMRETFHDPLLVRTPNGYIKTVRAEWLQTQLARSLATVRNALEEPIYNPAIEMGTFRLGTIDYGEVVLLPKLWELLSSACPNAKLELIQRDLYSAWEVENYKADVSIGLMPHHSFNNCNFEPIFEERYVCVMCKNHPIAKVELTLDRYTAYGHSVIKTATSQISSVDDVLNKLGSPREIKRQSPNFLAAHRSLRNTDLLLTTPARLAADISAADDLVIKELPFDLDPVIIYQIWHVKNTNTPRQIWLREQIKLAGKSLGSTNSFKK